jgi:integrase
MPKITKRIIDGLVPENTRDVFCWDRELRGFGIRLKPSGAGAFIIQYRNIDGRSRRMVLGKLGTLTPNEARGLARDHLASVAKGADPSHHRHQRRAAPSVAEVCDEYLAAAEKRRATLKGQAKRKRGFPKLSTIAKDRSRVECHVKPVIGRISVKALTKADLEKLQDDIAAGKTAKQKADKGRGTPTRGGPAAAARVVGMMGAILEYALTKNLIGVNPARGILKFEQQKRRRFLSDEEIQALGRALTEAEHKAGNPVACASIRFLLLTGFRKMEALSLKWTDIEGKRRCIHLPDSKSGAQTRAIGSAAIRILEGQQRIDGVPWVFPAAVGTGHAIGVPKVLGRICAAAKIYGVTLHTLRHTFASIAAELGYSELTIAGLLGHSVPGVTARYSHLPDIALLGAAERVAGVIADRLEGTQSGGVIVALNRS